MVYSVGNQFGLNVNRQYPKGTAAVGTGRDLRDKYTLTAQLNDFKSYLSQNGYSYEQYQYDKWNAQMMAHEQQQIANQEALSTSMSNLKTIASTGKDLINTIKGWFS